MNGISNTTSTGAAGINYTGSLTPDALMMYCASRLHQLDGQMQDDFAKQQKYREASSALNAAQTMLAGHSGKTGLDQGQLTDAIANLRTAVDTMPPDSPALGPARDQLNYLTTEANKGNGLAAPLCKAYADSLSQISKDMGGSAELDMMNLQSLMSQRQTAVQLCTNLIASLGETSKAIASKVGA